MKSEYCENLRIMTIIVRKAQLKGFRSHGPNIQIFC
jgi:hypothetical protein